MPNEYTLNFLWINLNPQNRTHNIAQNIFKDGLDYSENINCLKLDNVSEEIKNSFMCQIAKWAKANPNTNINLWYDSALVTSTAHINTLNLMKDISSSLRLRDVRELSLKEEIKHSLHPGVPVYFRIDWLKVLIADHMLNEPDEPKYFVFSDIDIKPMDSKSLFDERTLDYLTNEGYAFSRVIYDEFENNFFMFNKEKNNLNKIHRETMIELVASKITHLRQYSKDTKFVKKSFESYTFFDFLYDNFSQIFGYFDPQARENILNSQYIFKQYGSFLTAMKENQVHLAPRKLIHSPKSQFKSYFPPTTHQAETFRFIGEDNVPYTKNGRAMKSVKNQAEGMETEEMETQIEELKDWQASPLNKKKL